jgi:tRNA(Ile)-lysidine synthase TilS/MesJ/sulfur carrier protein ThiS
MIFMKDDNEYININIDIKPNNYLSLDIPTNWTVRDTINSIGYSSDSFITLLNNKVISKSSYLNQNDNLTLLLVRSDYPFKNQTLLLLNNYSRKNNHTSLNNNQKKTCSSCDNDSVFNRRIVDFNSKEIIDYELCKDCFFEDIERRGLNTILLHKLVKKNEKIILCNSGEKDSIMALYLLSRLKEKYFDFELISLFIDQGIEKYDLCRRKSAEKCAKDFKVNHMTVSYEETFGYNLKEILDESRKGTNKAIEIWKPFEQIYGKKFLEILGMKNSPIWKGCFICGLLRNKMVKDITDELKINKIATGSNFDELTCPVVLGPLTRSLVVPFYPAEKIFTPLSLDTFKLEKYNHAFKKNYINVLANLHEEEIAYFNHLKKFSTHWHYQQECPYHTDAIGVKYSYLISEINDILPGYAYTTRWKLEKIFNKTKQKETKKEVLSKNIIKNKKIKLISHPGLRYFKKEMKILVFHPILADIIELDDTYINLIKNSTGLNDIDTIIENSLKELKITEREIILNKIEKMINDGILIKR